MHDNDNAEDSPSRPESKGRGEAARKKTKRSSAKKKTSTGKSRARKKSASKKTSDKKPPREETGAAGLEPQAQEAAAPDDTGHAGEAAAPDRPEHEPEVVVVDAPAPFPINHAVRSMFDEIEDGDTDPTSSERLTVDEREYREASEILDILDDRGTMTVQQADDESIPEETVRELVDVAEDDGSKEWEDLVGTLVDGESLMEIGPAEEAAVEDELEELEAKIAASVEHALADVEPQADSSKPLDMSWPSESQLDSDAFDADGFDADGVDADSFDAETPGGKPGDEEQLEAGPLAVPPVELDAAPIVTVPLGERPALFERWIVPICLAMVFFWGCMVGWMIAQAVALQ